MKAKVSKALPGFYFGFPRAWIQPPVQAGRFELGMIAIFKTDIAVNHAAVF
jgi:hypothetical protein